jgi:hypothetical protein
VKQVNICWFSQWAETRALFIGARSNFAVEYARRLKETQEGLYFNGLNLVLVYAEKWICWVRI